MKSERSMSPGPVLAAGLGALLLVSGTLVGAAPVVAQESVEESAQEEAERRLEAVLAHQDEAIRVELAQARAQLERRQAAERAALEAALQEARAPQVKARVRGSGLAMFGLRGPSADMILARAEELGLDDGQVERIRGIHRQYRREEIERDASIEVAELDLEDLMHEDEAMDLQAVEAKMMEIAGLRVRSRIADLRLRREVEAVLTAEQRDKLDDMDGGFLFRTRGDGPSTFFFRGGDDGWRHLMDDGAHRRLWLQEALEPLREMRWFRFERGDDEDQDQDQESEDGGVVGM